MEQARRFDPTAASGVWVQLVLGALLLVIAVPLVVWWRDLDVSVALQAAMVAVALLAWFLKVWFGTRHRGALIVHDHGLTLKTTAGTHRVAWADIHRVHRFGDRLVFETTPPHRRYTLLLDGHEHHLVAMVKTLRARAPATDLRWVDTLGSLLG